MANKKLSGILSLVEMQVRAGQADLRKIHMREARLKTLLCDLDLQKGDTNAAVIATKSSILDFQNDIQLRRWLDQKRSSVNTELAQVRALITMQQEKLTLHFSRQQALETLTERSEQVATQRIVRKSYYGD